MKQANKIELLTQLTSAAERSIDNLVGEAFNTYEAATGESIPYGDITPDQQIRLNNITLDLVRLVLELCNDNATTKSI